MHGYSSNLLTRILATFTCLAVCVGHCLAADNEVFQANGIKIGEVSSTSAIVWTRVTAIDKPPSEGVAFVRLDKVQRLKLNELEDHELGPEREFGYQLPSGVKLKDTSHAVPGISGEIQLSYWEPNNISTKRVLNWQSVHPDSDYTKHFTLTGLKPGTKYELTVDARKDGSSPVTSTVHGSFRTAPPADEVQPITFAVTTCTDYHLRDDGDRGHRIFKTMSSMQLDFMVHAGDIVYYDVSRPYVTHIDLARHHWNRMFSLSNLVELLKEVPAYWMKDDHDSWDNDCWPTMPEEMGLFTYEQGKRVFDEQVPMSDPRHYRTFRWGKDLQIWMVEVRDFRSPNFDLDGPDKSLWGKEQVNWFKRTVEASDATFKILVSPTPMVGPDHLWKGAMNDNHADDGWAYEGNMLREYIASQANMYFICGDRHWQYISRHPKTGMLEYAVGASTDKHAIFMENDDTSMHLYYGPDKGGFLTVNISRENGLPTARFRHHGVDGELFHENVHVSAD